MRPREVTALLDSYVILVNCFLQVALTREGPSHLVVSFRIMRLFGDCRPKLRYRLLQSPQAVKSDSQFEMGFRKAGAPLLDCRLEGLDRGIEVSLLDEHAP